MPSAGSSSPPLRRARAADTLRAMKIVALVGSLRSGSFNLRLAQALSSIAPAGVIDVAPILGIPLYDADVEAAGIPEPVTALKDRIAAANGLLIVTPEYNGGIPGVAKNAVDWLSRPAADLPRVFGGKPTGLVGATPGPVGTRLAQTAWLPVLRALGAVPYFGHALYVDGAGKAFDAAGALVDDKLRERATRYVEGFTAFVAGSVAAAKR